MPGFPPEANSTAAPPSTVRASPASAPLSASGGLTEGMRPFPGGNWTTSGTMTPGFNPFGGKSGMGGFHDCPQCRHMMGDDLFISFPDIPGSSSGGGSRGFPGAVTANSDGTNGPQTSSNFTNFSFNSEKDEPGKL